MNEIAILTQPLLENYGVIPQNFALKYKLNKLGFELIIN